jgi:hypothetical protein
MPKGLAHHWPLRNVDWTCDAVGSIHVQLRCYTTCCAAAGCVQSMKRRRARHLRVASGREGCGRRGAKLNRIMAMRRRGSFSYEFHPSRPPAAERNNAFMIAASHSHLPSKLQSQTNRIFIIIKRKRHTSDRRCNDTSK